MTAGTISQAGRVALLANGGVPNFDDPNYTGGAPARSSALASSRSSRGSSADEGSEPPTERDLSDYALRERLELEEALATAASMEASLPGGHGGGYHGAPHYAGQGGGAASSLDDDLARALAASMADAGGGAAGPSDGPPMAGRQDSIPFQDATGYDAADVFRHCMSGAVRRRALLAFVGLAFEHSRRRALLSK